MRAKRDKKAVMVAARIGEEESDRLDRVLAALEKKLGCDVTRSKYVRIALGNALSSSEHELGIKRSKRWKSSFLEELAGSKKGGSA